MPHGVGVFVGKLKTWDKGGFSKAQVWDSRQTETVRAGHRVFSCLHLHVCCVRAWGGASHLCPLQFSFLSLVTSASTPVPFQSVCCVLFREEPASSRWPSLLSVQKPSFQRAQSCLATDIYLPPVSPRHASGHVAIPWLHPFQGFVWFITGKIQHPWLSQGLCWSWHLGQLPPLLFLLALPLWLYLSFLSRLLTCLWMSSLNKLLSPLLF